MTTTLDKTTPELTTSDVNKVTNKVTTPNNHGVDCSKCVFSQGQIWRPDLNNCHALVK